MNVYDWYLLTTFTMSVWLGTAAARVSWSLMSRGAYRNLH